ncbi:arginine--tRNA ligase [Actinocatenispora rupis]|uniref:Arginine--tRNA ligase n=1 Tax=Actinocatenispora rupis TaxID=519421 RepID=A0A8J3JBN5_9ACTN|nr:arginine--tRNA ligase [Actinocatenispora rupis]GID11838.1 arginine--tRNA ligase [Actinocatenispora rupis]
MTGIEGLLHARLSAAFASVAGAPTDPVLRRSRRADFQADGALALSRTLGRPPREVAAEVAAAADLADLSTVDTAGPGFLNLTVRGDVLGGLLADTAADVRLGVPRVADPRTVVVDYSGPNAAKEMHVGHLRSTILGDALARLLDHLGHRVVRQNHVGDWGTPFGMLIEHLLDVGGATAAHALSAGDLSGFYRAARAAFDTDPAFRERSRRRVVLLQSGDPATLRLWRVLVTGSQDYFRSVYALLGVRLTDDDLDGESRYDERLGDVVDELDRAGLLRESDGALCAFPAGFTGRDGTPLPLIVRKSDGGFGYAATDLATIRYRLGELAATRLLYVVGEPQRQHLAMVFATARDAGWLTDAASAEHVAFGSVLGADGRMLRTRAGDSVTLVALLTEAVRRAAELVPDGADSGALARAVGIGAVKYADLSAERGKDYVFDYDRMLAFTGDTAPYLQYARARILSIFRRAGLTEAAAVDTVLVTEPAERALALDLLAFPATLHEVADTALVHRLTRYLFRLAAAYTDFYESCPVLSAPEPTRGSRLVLCDLTARTLATGLDLLGIEAPDRM